ncbi:hypothetical protein [Nonomuraea sp. NPDC003214]
MVFRARLGLTVATLAADVDADISAVVHDQVAAEVIESGDGYAARDLLTDHPVEGLSGRHHQMLTRVVESSGLGAKHLPAPLLDSLTCSVKSASEALVATV